MKNIIRRALVVCLPAVFSLGLLSAGVADGMKVTLTQPTSVGGVTLPAGTYVVRDMSTTGSTPVLQFHSDKGVSASVLATPLGAQSSNETKLVLKEVNQKLEVEQIWLGEQGGFEITSQAVK